MKRFFSYMMALLTAVAAIPSCSNYDEAPESRGYTLNVAASRTAESKALTYINNSFSKDFIQVSWGSSDRVMTYDSSYGTKYGELAPNGNGTIVTKLSGTIDEAPSVGSVLSLVFPRYPLDYTGQKGTLEDIAANFDYATATTSVTEVSSGSVSTSSATFSDEQAILKIGLYTDDGNGGSTSFTATDLVISDSSGNLVQSSDLNGNVTPGSVSVSSVNATNEFYVALKSTGTMNLDFNAYNRSDGSSYTFSKSGVSFDSGKYYPIKIKFNSASTASTSSGTGAAVVPHIAFHIRFPSGYSYIVSIIEIFSGSDKITIDKPTVETDLSTNVQHMDINWYKGINKYPFTESGYVTFQMFLYGNKNCSATTTVYLDNPYYKVNHVYVTI